MKVFEKKIVVKKKEDDTFMLSIAVSDSLVISKPLSKKDMEQLRVDIEMILKGE